MDLGQLARALRSPVTWTQQVLKRQLYDGQIRMMEAVLRHPRVIIRGANATGKSYALACFVLWWLAANDDPEAPALVLVTSTSQRQIEQSAIFLEIRQIINDPSIEYKYPQPTLTKLEMPNGARATGFSAGIDQDESGVRLGGFHSRGPTLIVCDEASGLNPAVFKGVEGILASGGTLVLLTNPLVASGYAYEAATKYRGEGGFHSLKISALDTPNFENLSLEQLIAIPRDTPESAAVFQYKPWPALVSRRWAFDMIQQHGLDSPIVQARVLGEFPSGETQQSLLSLADIEAVATRTPPPPTHRLVAGIDVAGSDDGDSTVLIIRDGPTIVHMRSWTVADVRGEVMFELAPYRDRLESVNIDSVGIGHYFCSSFEDAGYPVQRINVASSPRHDSQGIYSNLRAELFFGGLRPRFQDGNIYSLVPWSDEVISQLSSLRWRIMPSSGKVAIEPKVQAKARGCPSPDIADAIALAFANEGESIEPLVRYYRGESNGQSQNVDLMRRAEPVHESEAQIAHEQLLGSLDGLPGPAQSRFRGERRAAIEQSGHDSNAKREYLRAQAKYRELTAEEITTVEDLGERAGSPSGPWTPPRVIDGRDHCPPGLRNLGGKPRELEPERPLFDVSGILQRIAKLAGSNGQGSPSDGEPPPMSRIVDTEPPRLPPGPPPGTPEPSPPQIDGQAFLDNIEKKGVLVIPGGSSISGFQLTNWIKLARNELKCNVKHKSGRPYFPGEGRP